MSQGFSEASGRFLNPSDPAPGIGRPPTPFKSTGPHGHRDRMRGRLLDRGAGALADYEILEMLLFLGLPRGDTKPLAKAMINRFGSLAAVLGADRRALLAAPNINAACADAIGLVGDACLKLAAADGREAPVFPDQTALAVYLRPARRRITRFVPGQQNRLLADEARTTAALDAEAVGAILRRALELHGVALLLATWRNDAVPLRSDRDGLTRLRAAGSAVSVAVHDLFLVAPGGLASVSRTL